MKLVLATHNQGKVRELTKMLHNRAATGEPVEVISLQNYPNAPEVVEDGQTYLENAIKKASVIAEYTGLMALADDAGLEEIGRAHV